MAVPVQEPLIESSKPLNSLASWRPCDSAIQRVVLTSKSFQVPKFRTASKQSSPACFPPLFLSSNRPQEVVGPPTSWLVFSARSSLGSLTSADLVPHLLIIMPVCREYACPVSASAPSTTSAP